MKPILLAVALLACTSLAQAQENKNINSVEAAVLSAEMSWEKALTNADASALQTLYDDTLVYTHSNGKVDTKSSYISAIKSGATKYLSMKRDDIKVSIYGQAAVVSCHWEVHISSSGNKVDMNARYLHVYTRNKDGWKLVAHESTRIS
jgi:ketosteroid isomerase-like protein